MGRKLTPSTKKQCLIKKKTKKILKHFLTPDEKGWTDATGENNRNSR